MTKAERILGSWAYIKGYDAWDVFIGQLKWCRLIAQTNKPVQVMLTNHPTANIDWSIVRAVKLT